MNQPRPARPPRFLFSCSSPRAAGAVPLHRRGFPGTLPPTPLSALGAVWLLLDSLTKRFRIAEGRPCHPPRPSPPPRHLAVASPGAAGAALKRSRGGAAARVCEGVSVCARVRVCVQRCVGLSAPEPRKTRRGAPATRLLGSRPMRGSGGAPAALARRRVWTAHLPRGYPACPAQSRVLGCGPPGLSQPWRPRRRWQPARVRRGARQETHAR